MHTLNNCCVLFIAGAGLSLAQVAVSSGISPVPIVPPPGRSYPEGQYVFLGPSIRELTLVYPRKDADGQVYGIEKTVRVPMVNQVRVGLECDVIKRADGQFEYTYRLRNGTEAVQPITSWSLNIPWNAGRFEETTSWTVRNDGKRPPARERDTLYSPEASPAGPGISLGNPALMTWELRKPVPPGGEQFGFKIVSPLAPGPTKAYARSGLLSLPADLPEEVKKQLIAFESPEWRDQITLTIGPRYPATLLGLMPASDFAHALLTMVDRGQIRSDSVFVKSALSALETYMSANSQALMPKAQLQSLVGSACETELTFARALQMTMGND